VKKPFYGGYGLIAAGSIPKLSFTAFRVLHQLGRERITLDSDSALATRASDGSLVVAVWNLVPPISFLQTKSGSAKTVVIRSRIWAVCARRIFPEPMGSMATRVRFTKKMGVAYLSHASAIAEAA